jgi:hypothetical protein
MSRLDSNHAFLFNFEGNRVAPQIIVDLLRKHGVREETKKMQCLHDVTEDTIKSAFVALRADAKNAFMLFVPSW